MSEDLITWLRAQLDEDERVAHAAAGGGRWRYSDGDSVGAWTLYDEHWNIASLTTYRHSDYDYSERMPAFRHPAYVDADANGEHIARHDPARVLAEVEATRRILDLVPDIQDAEDTARQDYGSDAKAAKRLVRWLALPYADKPGYREEWRPDGA